MGRRHHRQRHRHRHHRDWSQAAGDSDGGAVVVGTCSLGAGSENGEISVRRERKPFVALMSSMHWKTDSAAETSESAVLLM